MKMKCKQCRESKQGDFPIGNGVDMGIPYGPNLVDRANIWWIRIAIIGLTFVSVSWNVQRSRFHTTSAKAQFEHSIGRHEFGFCGMGCDVVKFFCGADPLW